MPVELKSLSEVGDWGSLQATQTRRKVWVILPVRGHTQRGRKIRELGVAGEMYSGGRREGEKTVTS